LSRRGGSIISVTANGVYHVRGFHMAETFDALAVKAQRLPEDPGIRLPRRRGEKLVEPRKGTKRRDRGDVRFKTIGDREIRTPRKKDRALARTRAWVSISPRHSPPLAQEGDQALHFDHGLIGQEYPNIRRW